MSDIMIEIAERVAKGMPTSYTKADFYRELDERAQRERKPGETREQAFARYATTDPDGRSLFAAHRVAQAHADMVRTHISVPTKAAHALNICF